MYRHVNKTFVCRSELAQWNVCSLLPEDGNYEAAVPLLFSKPTNRENTEELNECLSARQRKQPHHGTNTDLETATPELAKAASLVEKTKVLDNVALEASFLDRALTIRSR